MNNLNLLYLNIILLFILILDSGGDGFITLPEFSHSFSAALNRFKNSNLKPTTEDILRHATLLQFEVCFFLFFPFFPF